MNLKLKLIITFGIVIAVPALLVMVVFWGFMSLQPEGVVTPQTEEFLVEMEIILVLLHMGMIQVLQALAQTFTAM